MADRSKSSGRVAPQEASEAAPEQPTVAGTPENQDVPADEPQFRVSHDFNRVSVGGVDFEDGQVVDARDAALVSTVPGVKVAEAS